MTKNQLVKLSIGNPRKPSPTKRKRESASKANSTPNNPYDEPLKCSKCPDGVENSFKNRQEFYVHVLECGGEVDWDGSSKKKSKKKKKVSSTSRPRKEETAGKLKFWFDPVPTRDPNSPTGNDPWGIWG